MPRMPRAVATLSFSILILLAVATGSAAAQNTNDFGLGLILGDPTGANCKYMLSPEMAIDGAIGFGIIGGDHLNIHADFLWQFDIQQWPAGSLDLYLGVGPKLAVGRGKTDLLLGARAPIGVSFLFSKVPIDIFLEVAIGLFIVEEVDLDVDAAIGARYWF
jgi:hypothetical protein